LIDKTPRSEKRKSSHYNLRSEDYKVFIGKSKAIGKTNNISLDGLAFTYNPIEDERLTEEKNDKLPIDYGGFHLPEIHCIKIYDIQDLTEGQTLSGRTTRRCGVCFVNLTILNKLKIKQMLHICKSRILENVAKSKGP
jgi:hypothetical protein